MPRDDGEGYGDAAMRDGDARIGGHGDGRSHAWHDFKRQAVFRQEQGFLAAAPEDEGVAALEAHDAFSFAGELDEEFRDVFLLHRVVARAFSHVDALGFLRHEREDAAVREVVIDDGVGFFETRVRLDRQKPRVSGAGSDKIYHSFAFLLTVAAGRVPAGFLCRPWRAVPRRARGRLPGHRERCPPSSCDRGARRLWRR